MKKMFAVIPKGDKVLDAATVFEDIKQVENFLLTSNAEFDVYEAAKLDIRVVKTVQFGSPVVKEPRKYPSTRKPRATITREVLNAMVTLRDSGMSYTEIAKKVGVAESTAMRRCNEEHAKRLC